MHNYIRKYFPNIAVEHLPRFITLPSLEHLAYCKKIKKIKHRRFISRSQTKSIIELLTSEDMYKIPITLLIRNNSFSFNYENAKCGYYVYMKVWSPFLAERFFGKKQPSNGVDRNAVTVICLNNMVKKKW